MTMRFPMPIAVVVSSFVLGMAASAGADIYRCKRADGTQHYTNVREQGGRCQVVVRGSKKSKSKGSAKKSGGPSKKATGTRTKDPIRYTRYNNLIAEAAQLYQLPYSFIRAVMRVAHAPGVGAEAGGAGPGGCPTTGTRA